MTAIFFCITWIGASHGAFASDDISSVTTAAKRDTPIVGEGTSAQVKTILKIPMHERLQAVSISSGKWLTEIVWSYSNGQTEKWGNRKQDPQRMFSLKSEEYIEGVKVQLDAEANIDWMDLITSANRILHFGIPKFDEKGARTFLLQIPKNSRVIGLTIYGGKGSRPEIDGISAAYQTAN